MSQDSIIVDRRLFKMLKMALILSGLKSKKRGKSRLVNKFYPWILTINLLMCATFLCLLLVHFIRLIMVDGDIGIMLANLSLALFVFPLIIKIIIIKVNKVDNIIKDLNKKEKKIARSTDKKMILYYVKKAKYYRNFNMGVFYIIIVELVVMSVLACIKYLYDDKSVSLTEKSIAERFYFYPIWLPWTEREHFKLVFLINLFFGYAVALLFVTLYMTFVTLLIGASNKLEMLQFKIKNMDHNLGDLEKNKCLYNNLLQIVKEHLSVIKFINQLNICMKQVVFVDFSFNSLNLAVAVVPLLMFKSFEQICYCVAVMVAVITQVLVLGWLSNEIKVQSLAVGEALYKIEWYNTDMKFRKVFLIMLHRSQRPMTISIGYFGPMTTEISLAILKAAYTFVSVMSNYSG